MKSFKALIKREFWEHKGVIFYSPLVIAGVLAGLMIISVLAGGTIQLDNESLTFQDHLPQLVEEFEQLSEQEQRSGVEVVLFAPALIFGQVLLFVSLFYALGCLYDERKDRSILFWKSLPVSDTATVLSKLATVCLLLPFAYFLVISMFQAFLLLFAIVSAWIGGGSGLAILGASNLLLVLVNSLGAYVVASLWLAPLWAWLMLASVWAKKVAFLWAGLPILLIAIAEGKLFNSTHFAEMLGERIAVAFSLQNSNLHQASGGNMFDVEVMNWYQAFAQTEFWFGLVVAGVLLAVTIYTRRFRDDS